MGRFRFSVLGVSRSLAVSRARIDARLTGKRKKSTPHPASPFASGIATKRWFFRLLTIRWRKLPRGKKNLLRNGPELREALVVQSAEFPGPRPDVRGPPSSAGFGVSRVLGSVGSSLIAAIVAAECQPARSNRVEGSGKIAGAGAVSSAARCGGPPLTPSARREMG